MPRHTRQNPSTNLAGNATYGGIDDPERLIRANRANRRARLRRDNVQALLTTQYDPIRRAIFSHLNLGDLTNVRATSRLLNQENPAADPQQPQTALVPISCNALEIVPRQQTVTLVLVPPSPFAGFAVPDYQQSAWAYPWSHNNVPYGAMFDTVIQRPPNMQACPHTNRNNPNAIFRKCQGVSQGYANHGPSMLVCSICAERNWLDQYWALWYPFRIIPFCYDCSQTLHPTNAVHPDDDLENLCECVLDWNNYPQARDQWFCDDCAMTFGNTIRAGIDNNIQVTVLPHGNIGPPQLGIDSHVNPLAFNRNHCACGLTFQGIVNSYPLPSWIRTPPGVAFQSVSLGAEAYGWHNTKMYRQCMACLGHVPLAMISRMMNDILGMEP